MITVLTTKVLFVDDEPSIRELFPAMVEAIPGRWETHCVESGEKALKVLEAQSFDLVVSDMRMPGMTGAQLLNEVMKRFPGTGRIILSGYADQAEVLHCVGATHQFLAKPFQLPTLRAALNRIRNLREGLRSEEIQRLVTRKQSLPSLPAVFIELLEALQDPDCSTELIGDIVATDPALTARILQLVNSAFFGFAREVSTAQEAVMLLGTGTIRCLCLATHLFSSLRADESEAWSLQQLWWHSMRVGQWAKRIIEFEGGSADLAEQALTAGVLHDVGKLILLDQVSAGYLELLLRAEKENALLTTLEREQFGATHGEVGAYLLDLWGLPAPLVEAVAFHHEPGKSNETLFSPLTAVHVADVLEKAEKSPDPEAAMSQLDALYLDQLSLGARLQHWRDDLWAAAT